MRFAERSLQILDFRFELMLASAGLAVAGECRGAAVHEAVAPLGDRHVRDACPAPCFSQAHLAAEHRQNRPELLVGALVRVLSHLRLLELSSNLLLSQES